MLQFIRCSKIDNKVKQLTDCQSWQSDQIEKLKKQSVEINHKMKIRQETREKKGN